jgi:hypothetical protein
MIGFSADALAGIQPADGWSGFQWGSEAPWSMGWFQGKGSYGMLPS